MGSVEFNLVKGGVMNGIYRSMFVALALAGGFSNSAHALFGGGGRTVYCTNCATTDQADRIIENGTRLIQAIQGASSANTRAVSENARIVAEANATTEQRMEHARIAARYDLTDPCTVTAPGRGNVVVGERERGHASGRGASGGGGGGRAPATSGVSTPMRDAIAISEGSRPPPEPEATAALASKGACSSFVRGGERERMCIGAKFELGLSSGLPNADVRAETLFDGPQRVSDQQKGIVRRLSVPNGDSSERTAIAAYIRNLETPLDLRALRPKELDSIAGRNYMAMRDSYEAVMSLATKPLRDQELMMLDNRESLSAINQMLAGADASFVRRWLDSVYPAWASRGISALELMNLEAVRRYKNEGWYVRMAQQDERNLALESANMQALQIWQNNQMLERQQQQNILLGAIAGVLLRGEKMPGLIAQHKAAQTP